MSNFFSLEKIYKRYLLFICLFIIIYSFYLIFSLSNSGIDLTDEGYYLNWINNPYIYKSSIFQFGFLYNPIFIFFDENISNLRRANIIINFLLSYCLISVLIKSLIKFQKINFYYLQTFIIGFSLFIFLPIHIYTPGYNTLALQGLLITSVGVLFIENHKKFFGCIFIGLGGWLVFMGKPSSAAALAVIMVLYLITKKNSIILILSCATVTLIFLLLSSIAIDGSPTLFIQRILLDLNHYQLLGSGHAFKEIAKDLITIVAKPELQNKYAILSTIISMIAIILILYFSYYIDVKKEFNNYLYKIILISIIPILYFFTFSSYGELFLIFERYQKLQIFSIFTFSFFVALKSNKFNPLNTIKSLNLRLIILFLTLPIVYAFGSNVNLLKKSLDAGIFYLIASFIILIPYYQKNKNLNNLFIFLLCGLIIFSIHFNSLIQKPYRQLNSLDSNENILEIDNKGNTLKISAERKKYISKAKENAHQAGFLEGDFILDLTGKSPGLIYLLNAYSLGSPWMVGGAPGSFEYAKAKISLESCSKISNSWILYDNQSRSISLDLLNIFGADLLLDYQEVASWQAKEFKGAYEQKLFKPKQPNEIIQKCFMARNKLSK